MWIIEYDNGGVEEFENWAINGDIVEALMREFPRIISAVKVGKTVARASGRGATTSA